MIGWGPTVGRVPDGVAGESVHDFARAEQAVRDADREVELPHPDEYADLGRAW